MSVNLNSVSSNNSFSSVSRKRFNLTGKVINNVLNKTVTVIVVHNFRHSIYRKTVSRNKKYLVHDPENKCQIGDQVLIVSSRKISRHKSFFIARILKTANDKNIKKTDLKN